MRALRLSDPRALSWLPGMETRSGTAAGVLCALAVVVGGGVLSAVPPTRWMAVPVTLGLLIPVAWSGWLDGPMWGAIVGWLAAWALDSYYLADQGRVLEIARARLWVLVAVFGVWGWGLGRLGRTVRRLRSSLRRQREALRRIARVAEAGVSHDVELLASACTIEAAALVGTSHVSFEPVSADELPELLRDVGWTSITNRLGTLGYVVPGSGFAVPVTADGRQLGRLAVRDVPSDAALTTEVAWALMVVADMLAAGIVASRRMP